MAPTQTPRATQMSVVMSIVEEPEEPPPIQLSPEQEMVLVKVARGDNVFFTGPAGESGDHLPLIPLKSNMYIRYREVSPD